MGFKKHKYNFICLILIVVIAVAVACRVAFFDTSNNGIVTPPDSSSDQTLPDIKDDDNKPNLPSEDEDFANEVDRNLPSTRYPVKLLNYCIDKMSNSVGYYGEISFTTQITGSFAGVSMTGNQLTTGEIIKSQNKRYEAIKFEALNDITKQFTPKHNLEALYTDGTTYHLWETEFGCFDWSQAKCTSWSSEESSQHLFYYDLLYAGADAFPCAEKIAFNNSGASISVKSQKNSAGRTEYIVSVKLVDKDNYPTPFLRSYYSFGDGVNIKSIEQTITFTIDKQSGWIKNFVKKDTFIGNPYSFSSAEVKFQLNYTTNYSHHNQIIPIITPAI